MPEFEDHYFDLLDIYDEDLTPQVVFNELADFVTGLLQDGEREDTLERCFAAVEIVAIEPGADGTGLVAFCFLDQLPPFALEMARSYLEPVTETILELVEQDLLYEDDGELPCSPPTDSPPLPGPPRPITPCEAGLRRRLAGPGAVLGRPACPCGAASGGRGKLFSCPCSSSVSSDLMEAALAAETAS